MDKNQGNRRVLMVAYHYPPDHSSSGVLRTLKFSKYLPEHDWHPVVLTVREAAYDHADPALAEQIPPEVQVFRTRAINTKQHLSLYGKHLRICSIPDRFIGWLPFAVVAGLKIIRSERIKAIYSTSPLATAHLIASILKSRTKLPWIADFRDPWTEPELAPNPKAPLFRLECALERHVLRHADRLLFTTEQLRNYTIARVPGNGSNSKALVIPNGYDEDDFRRLPASLPDPMPLRITHAGLVDQVYRSPKGFLRALARLLESGEIRPERLRVDFLGGGSYLGSSEFRSLLEHLNLQHIVNIVERTSYSECLELQARSHILLLLQCTPDTNTLIPAKAFEYLRIGRPILALVPPSASSELFRQVGGAKVADPFDVAAIQQALREMLKAAQEGKVVSDVDASALHNYSRRALTARLAKELNEIC